MAEMQSNSRVAKPFDYSIKKELSDLLQRTKAFRADKELGRQFSLACVVQDRLFDAIGYLDAHLSTPRNNEEPCLFMANEEILILLAAALWMESAECRRNGMFPRKSFSYVFPSCNLCAIASNADTEN